jgi:hypothetical protein
VLVVQGGPGTGKTVVALHRAAYLLYTHRFPLEGQGVLVVGPNRLFLGYIEQVLPSLGEAGVELVVLADLLADAMSIVGNDAPATARVKGDLRMAKVLVNAVRDRRRPLREDLRIGFGVETLHVTVAESATIIADARRRARTHNAGRRFVEHALYEALARSSRNDAEAEAVRERLHNAQVVREALDWMWPVLTPAQLLHDLFGSRALSCSRQTTFPCSMRRARCSALALVARVEPRRTTRCAPTATSSSTKPRTCRRCSCGCWPDDRSTGR